MNMTKEERQIMTVEKTESAAPLVQPLQLGETLYRYVQLSGVHHYETIEAHETKFGPQFVVEDKMCRHGWHCQLLIATTNEGDFKFIRQINDREDCDRQEHWHETLDKEYFFRRTLPEALADVLKRQISLLEKAVADSQGRLAKEKAELARAQRSEKDAESVVAYFKTKAMV